MVLFKNLGDKLQIAALAQQMYPKHAQFFILQTARKPYDYLVVDLNVSTPKSYG